MNNAAMIMMIIAMVTVWGGLLLSIINLRRHPEE